MDKYKIINDKIGGTIKLGRNYAIYCDELQFELVIEMQNIINPPLASRIGGDIVHKKIQQYV
jgi:hypothetical protein